MPVEAAPALCHHQQVKGCAVLLVVGLEEVGGIRDEAFHLGGQEHLREDIAGIIGVVFRSGIADGEGDTLRWHRRARNG